MLANQNLNLNTFLSPLPSMAYGTAMENKAKELSLKLLVTLNLTVA
jgi:hypothetical protein